MVWTENLRQGSFRGVKFFIDNHDFSSGRHTALHEFPEREIPFAEDISKKAERFNITGHLIGDDYFSERDALVTALLKGGPGELIHPYLGLKIVNATDFTVSEDNKQGRIVSISMTFVEAGESQLPTGIEDKQASLLESTSAAISEAKKDFESKFSVASQPAHVVDSATAGVELAADAVDLATTPVQVVTEQMAELSFSLRKLKSESTDLVQEPGELAERFDDALSRLTAVTTNKEESVKAYGNFYDYQGQEITIPNTTPERQQQQINEDETNKLLKRIAILRSAEDVTEIEFASTDEALEKRQEISELIQGEMETTDNDDFYQAMSDVDAKLVEGVPDEKRDLPSIVVITPQKTTNSLVLAYDLFEDADKEQDIINRNNLKHPGFVLGGESLAVLSG